VLHEVADRPPIKFINKTKQKILNVTNFFLLLDQMLYNILGFKNVHVR